ncbi:MAG: hypothetical protein ACKVU0_12545 [Saprospiraceae bacterium]
MADKNFFDLLRDKMAALRPSEKHRDDDWVALGERLNAALPPQPQGKRQAIVLPLLLVAALLASNAMWFQSSRSDQASLTRLEAQIGDLKASIAALGTAPDALQPKVLHDTLWRTVYVRSNEMGSKQSVRNEKSGIANTKASQDLSLHTSGVPIFLPIRDSQFESKSPTYSEKVSNPIIDEKLSHAIPDSILGVSDLPPLEILEIALIDIPKPEIHLPKSLLILTQQEEKLTERFSKKLTEALRPKFFKLGGNIGLIYPNSTGVMHEGGFSYGLQGQVGLSRHWSLTAAFNAQKFHYKAHDPAAILGAPELPTPGHGQHILEIDVTGQRIQQFDFGLRYTLSKPGKLRPFIGLGWGGLSLMPYDLEYEIQEEIHGTIQKAVFSISERTRLRNILRFGTGLQIPLSPRFDLTLEGFYIRQWKKPSGIAPDFFGVQGGVQWLF